MESEKWSKSRYYSHVITRAHETGFVGAERTRMERQEKRRGQGHWTGCCGWFPRYSITPALVNGGPFGNGSSFSLPHLSFLLSLYPAPIGHLCSRGHGLEVEAIKGTASRPFRKLSSAAGQTSHRCLLSFPALFRCLVWRL